jgi:DNA-binding response OmpR family regulator
MKILLAEDDPNLGQLLQEYLNLKGYPTDLAKNGEEGLAAFLKNPYYDFCIFDVMMPKKDGFTLAKEIRMANKSVPILFLTAKNLKEDTLQGFRVGADDYMTKPFSMEELLLRIQAIMRRSNPNQAAGPSTKIKVTSFNIGQTMVFDYEHQTLLMDKDKIKLTSKESELLKLLCQNMNQPLSRSFALKIVWGDDSYFNARSMDVYITKLRKYLRFDPEVQIMNMHGEGFKLITA